MEKWTLWGVTMLMVVWAGACAQFNDPHIPGTGGDNLTAGPVSLNEKSMYAKALGNSLEVYFPLSNAGTKALGGEIQATCRHLLDDFTVTGTAAFQLDPGEEYVALHLDSVPPFAGTGGQAEYVVDYTIKLADAGTIKGSRSLFMLIEKRDLLVLVPQKMFQGQATAVRAFLTDPRDGRPIPDTKVTVTVAAGEGAERQVSADTDEYGVAVFELTEDEVGSMSLRAEVLGDVENQVVETAVQVVRESKLLLTSDKPMYQPGQVMHLRALALDRFSQLPRSDQPVLFEVFDAKGNKVFKQEGISNAYGVAWARFVLGNQVLLGQYTLRVSVGEVISEKTVTVDRYSLPKFKVDLKLNRSFYQAGQQLTGEVNAQYFFGKPVAGGTVTMTMYKYVGQWTPDKETVGQTNSEGFYAFQYRIPDYVVGQPLEGGKAMLLMELVVRDTAEHSETVARSLLVVKETLDVALVPEGGTVVPGVANNFYLFVTDPLGNPVQAACTLTVNGAEFDDEDDIVQIPPFGPAIVSLIPHAGTLKVDVAAQDSQGSSANRSFNYSVGAQESSILLRTDKTIYKVGDTAEVTAYVMGAHHHIFLDVLRKNQVVLTTTLTVTDGVAQLPLDLDSELSQDLVLNAYMLADSGQIVRSTRVIFVQPASDLHIQVSSDKEEYLPGEVATVSFEIKDVNNAPTQAALGIQVVDEAVFAISDMKPGLLELYFYLEDELSKPSYQVGAGTGVSFGQLYAQSTNMEPGSEQELGLQDTAAAVLASMGEAVFDQQKLSSWKDTLADMKTAVLPYYDAMRTDVANRLSAVLALRNAEYDQACGILSDYLGTPRYYDSWGSQIFMTVAGGDWSCNITLLSAGPDELFDTNDDYSTTLDLYALMGGRWKGGDRWGWDWMGEPGMADEDGNWAGPPQAGGQGDATTSTDSGSSGGGEEGEGSSVRVRKWFPETLFVAPSIITDELGLASIQIPLADSITEWRMTTLASSAAGQLGSRADGILVFKEFFVDIDFPKYLTQNDEIRFPIAIYNYLETPQTIEVQVMQEDWFQLMGTDQQQVTLGAGEVTVVYFPVKVLTVGWHSLTVYGLGANSAAADAIQRTVEVRPDGKEIVETDSARFKNDGETPSNDLVAKVVEFPVNAIPGSQSIVVQVLPGLSSHIVQGMDSIFNLPGGCFEQTTSSAWPNVLALRYMIESGTITPEIELKAISYVNIGYQRVLTFECASGGFNWWEGDNPGNPILSAVGIMMLSDTRRIYDTVDEKVIQRSADYLFSVQKTDGSWSEEQHLHAGNENLGTSSLRSTCYITWGLAQGGFTATSGVQSALSFIRSRVPGDMDPYTRAVCANAMAEARDSSGILTDILAWFHDNAEVGEDTVHWKATGATLVNSWGNGADVELTALVALALAARNAYPQDFQGAINWLVSTKDPQGNWGYNTQATVLALKAFLAALTANPGNVDATIDVLFNGAVVATKNFSNFNKDVVWQVELDQSLSPTQNIVELAFTGTGALSYQIVSTHYIPWVDAPEIGGPLSIKVEYDSTTVAVDDIITATVTITNNDPDLVGMVLVTLGIPPGFALVTQDLAALRVDGTISEFEVTGKQIILYFNGIPAGEPTVLSYSLVAQYPIKAQTGGSEVHMYYDSQTNAEDASQQIEVVE